jgi:hypothetical protein
MSKRLLIEALILAGIVAVLDLLSYLILGNPATLSAKTHVLDWFFPSAQYAFGVLAAHFCLQDRAPSTTAVPAPAWRAQGQLVSFSLWIGWITWDVLSYFIDGHVGLLSQRVEAYHKAIFFAGLLVGWVFYQMHEATEFPPEGSK